MVRVNVKKPKNKLSELYKKGRDVYDTVDDYTDFSNDDFVPGLVPIGDTGLYITPSEPADPRDCDRYPSSPYCGENPFTTDPIGLDPEIIVNQCDIGIRLSPVLGFVKLPEFNLVYRKPECRVPSEQTEPEIDTEGDYSTPLFIPDVDVTDTNFCFLIFRDSYEATNYIEYSYGDVIRTRTSCQVQLVNFLYPYTTTQYKEFFRYVNGVAYPYYLPVKAKVTLKVTATTYFNEDYRRIYSSSTPYNESEEYEQHHNFYHESLLTDETPNDVFALTPATANFGGHPVGDDYNRVLSTLHGIRDLNSVKRDIRNLRNFRRTVVRDEHVVSDFIGEYDYHSESQETAHYTVLIKTITGQIKPPPPPKDKCCMGCCPPQNDDLLKTILKKVNKLSEIVGVENYPITVPESFITEYTSDGNPIQVKTKELNSLTEFLHWYVERFDELMGQWEVPIEIKDNDPTTPGDQPQRLKLPNLAESIGEIMQLLLQISVDSELHTNMLTRGLIEAAQDKQQNFITYKAIFSIVEYLGFKFNDVLAEMPLSIQPSAKTFDKLLQNTTVKVPTIDYDEKFNLQADLMRMRKMASILDSVYYRKIDVNRDIKQQIMKNILGLGDLVSNINEDQDDEDFEKFLKDVETGFTSTPNVGDPTRPYGRDYEDRPRFKDFNSESGQQL